MPLTYTPLTRGAVVSTAKLALAPLASGLPAKSLVPELAAFTVNVYVPLLPVSGARPDSV